VEFIQVLALVVVVLFIDSSGEVDPPLSGGTEEKAASKPENG